MFPCIVLRRFLLFTVVVFISGSVVAFLFVTSMSQSEKLRARLKQGKTYNSPPSMLLWTKEFVH